MNGIKKYEIVIRCSQINKSVVSNCIGMKPFYTCFPENFFSAQTTSRRLWQALIIKILTDKSLLKMKKKPTKPDVIITDDMSEKEPSIRLNVVLDFNGKRHSNAGLQPLFDDMFREMCKHYQENAKNDPKTCKHSYYQINRYWNICTSCATLKPTQHI